ncbi:MAG TPA: class I SAM-dependent methyltransferase family protein [Chloroflexota bacterium]
MSLDLGERLLWLPVRVAFRTVGRLSTGVRTGQREGFSSGQMLDYVYENRARGLTPLGRALDRLFLDAAGWRGIRERRTNLARTLAAIVLARRAAGRPTRVLDVAAGPGRYLLDLADLVGSEGLDLMARDADSGAVARGRALAEARGVACADFAVHDALDPTALAATRPVPDVVVASGLYEILTDDAAVRASLGGIQALLPPGGLVVVTGQPRHPQLRFIAGVLTHRGGRPWVMRPRPIVELEGYLAQAGFVDAHTTADSQGIFTITLARRP